jgi:hypothetical protein
VQSRKKKRSEWKVGEGRQDQRSLPVKETRYRRDAQRVREERERERRGERGEREDREKDKLPLGPNEVRVICDNSLVAPMFR